MKNSQITVGSAHVCTMHELKCWSIDFAMHVCKTHVNIRSIEPQLLMIRPYPDLH